MIRTHHLSMTAAVIICLVSTQWNSTLSASEDERSSREASSSVSLTNSTSDTQSSTSGELGPTEHSHFTLDAGALAANPSPGLLAQGGLRTFNFNFAPNQTSAMAGQIYRGQPRSYRSGRDGSIAAMMIGAAAAITGAAILIYANRPECETNRYGGGCGYGTKVVGGAVLSGGLVGIFVGALTW